MEAKRSREQGPAAALVQPPTHKSHTSSIILFSANSQTPKLEEHTRTRYLPPPPRAHGLMVDGHMGTVQTDRVPPTAREILERRSATATQLAIPKIHPTTGHEKPRCHCKYKRSLRVLAASSCPRLVSQSLSVSDLTPHRRRHFLLPWLSCGLPAWAKTSPEKQTQVLQ
jgi:hypothetical protein